MENIKSKKPVTTKRVDITLKIENIELLKEHSKKSLIPISTFINSLISQYFSNNTNQ